MQKSNLTKKQLKFFEQEDLDFQADILHALSKKPISKVLKCGYILEMNYIYQNGGLGFHIDIKNNEGKILYNDNFIPDPEYTEIDGTETKSYITKLCVSFIKDTLAYAPDTLIKMFF